MTMSKLINTNNDEKKRFSNICVILDLNKNMKTETTNLSSNCLSTDKKILENLKTPLTLLLSPKYSSDLKTKNSLEQMKTA